MADTPATAATKPSTAAKPRKRFVGSRAGPSSKTLTSSMIAHQVPQDILEDVQLNNAIRALPQNYSFEIHKTIHHVRKNKATMVALQMPEGLQMFACTIADIIERYARETERSDDGGQLLFRTLGLQTL
jgi:2-(3-amino-3-carboxypropyl)histidine synthase